MATTYTVVWGDNLWNIAIKYLGNGLRWTEIAKANGISQSYPIIYPGQKLTIGSPSGSAPSSKTKSSKAKLQYFGLQAGTETTVFVTWTWSKSHTDNYRVIWYYATGDGVWFVGNDSTTKDKQSVYNAPSNATKTKVKVKPISTKHKVNKKDVSYWTAQWSNQKEYNFKNNPPKKPPVPTVKIEKYKLTATLNNLDINGNEIQFQVVKDNKTVAKTATVKIVKGSVSYSCTVSAGGHYTVRARGKRSKVYGDWSNYSGSLDTIPAKPGAISKVVAQSKTSIQITWSASKNTNAKTYTLEYADKKAYLGSSNQSTTVNGIENTYYLLGGLEPGHEYFFRVRAENKQGHSDWTAIKSGILGTKPQAPTTWSSSTTVISGESLVLYWVHNSEDGSSQKYGELEMYIDGKKETRTIKNSDDEDEKDKTSYYAIDTTKYLEGTKIEWRVRTSGVTLEYGEWSVQREINIYAPPTLDLNVTDLNGNAMATLTQFPFYVQGIPGPNSQSPIGYHLSVVALESYMTVDDIGNTESINVNQLVFDKYYDISTDLLVELSASNVDLENNIPYKVVCTVSMNSGLTAESESEFSVQWTDEEYDPNAEIGYDDTTYSAYIQPFAEDEDNELIPDLSLSVYRREFDGSFVEIISDVDNTGAVYSVDPHPALNYARYRIIAKDKATGAVSFYDPPGYPIQEKAVILQWDEEWAAFDTDIDSEMETQPWTGSLIRLPYNIDVSDDYGVDVSHVEYIGRSHPVSYYGTQIGETSQWSMDIDKSDEDTLYALRRLARWTGDVYVREPSGSGYWATVGVSFEQTHKELVIPVSLDITRVEGGM